VSRTSCSGHVRSGHGFSPANQSPVCVNADQKSGPGGGNQNAYRRGGNQARAMKRCEFLPDGGSPPAKLTFS
jgi:hypothetical protein